MLAADGRIVGAWLHTGKHSLIYPVNWREQALAAAADPSLMPTPTPTPMPRFAGPVNLVDRLGLRQTVRVNTKVPTQRPASLDPARVLASLDRPLVARATTERMAGLLSPATNPYTILFFEQPNGETIGLTYNHGANVLGSRDGWFEVDAPAEFIAVLRGSGQSPRRCAHTRRSAGAHAGRGEASADPVGVTGRDG